MVENAIAVAVSLIIAGLMVRFVDKKWGDSDDGNQI
jgi:hypothetical protein